MKVKLIPFQPLLSPTVPTLEGNVDYRCLRDLLLEVEQQLVGSGLEAQFLANDLEPWLKARPQVSAKAQQNRLLHSRRALRCNIARTLLQEDFREFAAHLADSQLLQHFCGVSPLASPSVPAKSTLQRYALWWPEEQVRQLVYDLIQTGAQEPAQLKLEAPLDLDVCFLDTTCLAAHIHYPVDWVLLRDATRTLMKAVLLIREQGLKHRMDPPEAFLRRMNRLCIQMTHAAKEQDSAGRRKRVFRQIDRLVGTVRAHAQRYRDLLEQDWPQTQWTQGQAQQVLRRMEEVLALLPQARQQARQRILAGEPVDNEDKILSLYEPDAQVIVRHKAGAEVEFGNTLLVGETQQGLIVDWKLFQESAPADARLLLQSLERIQRHLGQGPKAVGTDRGFDSADNQAELAQRRIYNGVCPRDPHTLKVRNRSWKFKGLQKRRGQTEGRIAILKHSFLGQPLRSKGFARRNLSVTWGVLTHNLWVIARLAQAQAKADEAKAAA